MEEKYNAQQGFTFNPLDPELSEGVVRRATISPWDTKQLYFWNLLSTDARYKILSEERCLKGKETHWLVTFRDFDPDLDPPPEAPPGVWEVGDATVSED